MSTAAAALVFHAWAQAGLQAELDSTVPVDDSPYGFVVDMARIQARYDKPGVIGARVHVESKTGAVELLDASVRAGDKHGLYVEVGRMKTPVSHEFMTPAPRMILPSRALLVSMAGKRAVGAMGGAHLAERVHLRVGAFDPVGSLPQAGAGLNFIGVADVELPAHLQLHIGGSGWAHPDDVAATLGEDTPGWDARSDLAVEYANQGWSLLAEGLTAHRLGGDGWDLGAVAQAAKRLNMGSSPYELEPALAGDATVQSGETVVRGTAAVNLHREDWHLVESLSWETEASFDSEGLVHVARLSLQAGF